MTAPGIETLASRIAKAYFDALGTGNFANVPWSRDVVLKTPLRPEPIEGRTAVEAFFRPLAGNLGPIHLDAVYTIPTRGVFVAEARGPRRDTGERRRAPSGHSAGGGVIGWAG
jgi:hypothetical protein